MSKKNKRNIKFIFQNKINKKMNNNFNIQKTKPTIIKKGSTEDIENESGWSTKLVIHKHCPYQAPLIVHITQEQMIFLDMMTKEFPDLEFGAYIHGEYVNENEFLIKSLDVPKQIVTSVHIDYKETYKANGMIHKHPNGCHSPSSDDIDFGNANHDISMIYSDGEIVWGSARFKTKCGCMIERNIEVNVLFNVDYEALKLKVEEASKQIEEKTYTLPITNFKKHHFGSKWDAPNTIKSTDTEEESLYDDDDEVKVTYKDKDLETDPELTDYQKLLTDNNSPENDFSHYDLPYKEYMAREYRDWQ